MCKNTSLLYLHISVHVMCIYIGFREIIHDEGCLNSSPLVWKIDTFKSVFFHTIKVEFKQTLTSTIITRQTLMAPCYIYIVISWLFILLWRMQLFIIYSPPHRWPPKRSSPWPWAGKKLKRSASIWSSGRTNELQNYTQTQAGALS